MRTIGVIIGDEVGVETGDPVVEVEDKTKIIGTTETAEEIGESINKDTMTIGDKGKITHHVVAGSSGTIRTIGTEEMTDKVAVEERSGIEVKVKVMGIEAGATDGTLTSNTLPQDTTQAHIIKIRTTTVLHLWGIKPSIQRRHLSTLHTHNNTQGQPHLHDHNRHQMYVNYVKALDTMIISVSSLATF